MLMALEIGDGDVVFSTVNSNVESLIFITGSTNSNAGARN